MLHVIIFCQSQYKDNGTQEHKYRNIEQPQGEKDQNGFYIKHQCMDQNESHNWIKSLTLLNAYNNGCQ